MEDRSGSYELKFAVLRRRLGAIGNRPSGAKARIGFGSFRHG